MGAFHILFLLPCGDVVFVDFGLNSYLVVVVDLLLILTQLLPPHCPLYTLDTPHTVAPTLPIASDCWTYLPHSYIAPLQLVPFTRYLHYLDPIVFGLRHCPQFPQSFLLLRSVTFPHYPIVPHYFIGSATFPGILLPSPLLPLPVTLLRYYVYTVRCWFYAHPCHTFVVNGCPRPNTPFPLPHAVCCWIRLHLVRFLPVTPTGWTLDILTLPLPVTGSL